MATAKNRRKRRRSPVQDRSRHTVGAILEAAARILERGTSATTNGIARLAGVSIGSLYEYFPNKDAIVEALIERHQAEALERLRREVTQLDPAHTPLPVGVRRLIELMLELHADRPGLHRFFVGYVMGLAPVRRRLAEAEREVRAEIIDWLVRHPEVRVPDHAVAGRIVVQGTDLLVHRWLEDGEELSSQTLADELCRLWIGYLRGSAPAPS